MHASRGELLEGWRRSLIFDPLPSLMQTENAAINYFTRRDLLGESVPSVESLWELNEVKRLLRKQKDDGSWSYGGVRSTRWRSGENYDQLETYRIIGQLIEKFGMTREHFAVRRAAEYLFLFQTDEGDFRGIYGTQYSPNYSAGIMELLIKAGYKHDKRIARGFEWLIDIRQLDGGWAIPLSTIGGRLNALTMNSATVQPNRAKPFSHLITGVVLRAFAAHELRRASSEAINAGALLASRFFRRDVYPSRDAPGFWIKFSFPFWFTDLLSSLDSLSRLEFDREDAAVRRALDWFVAQQRQSGLWELKMLRTADKELPHWLSLAICRVIKRLHE
jgi:hypothetical protein